MVPAKQIEPSAKSEFSWFPITAANGSSALHSPKPKNIHRSATPIPKVLLWAKKERPTWAEEG